MKVFYIVGHHAVGKTYLAEQLTVKLNAVYFDCSTFIKLAKNKVNPNISTTEWIKAGKKQFGKNFASDMFCEMVEPFIKNTKSQIIFITGCRALNSIKNINKHFHFDNFYILFLQADFYLLKASYETRGNIKISDKEFKKTLHEEVKRGLNKIGKYVNRHTAFCSNFTRQENGHLIINEVENYINLKLIK